MVTLADFRQIWLVDYEFHQPPGERPYPLCCVAHEWREGCTMRLWLEDTAPTLLPYACGRDSLFIAYYASAELSCHLALGWSLPAYVLDLYVEFRNLTNGRTRLLGHSLLDALATFGLDGLDVAEKDDMRALAQRGGPYTAEERQALLAYCESDVVALQKLLSVMLPYIDLPRALLRGRFMRAAAHMEHNGVPVDTARLQTLRDAWPTLQEELIRRIDRQYGVYDGRHFREERWFQWTQHQGIAWPVLPSGRLALDRDTFRDMAMVHPRVHPLRELRATLAQLRLEQLAVGHDGRNRTLLSAFRAKTSRNAPSTAKFIFGPAVWLRHLIHPQPGYGVAYVDWKQQEFGIAAALSGDTAMCDAYQSGDPYLAFARQAGAVPVTATKATHGAVREVFKACVLAVAYGMGAEALAYRIGQSLAHARMLLRLHRQTYPRFWAWADSAVDYALLKGSIQTVFGWTLHVEEPVNIRTLRNFPAQGNGAEMLRLACSLATECGVEVVAPVHDALLIHAPIDELAHAVAVTQRCMQHASETVSAGFALQTDAQTFLYPDHYRDERGVAMWQTVWAIMEDAVAA
jgi:DNA polymerase I